MYTEYREKVKFAIVSKMGRGNRRGGMKGNSSASNGRHHPYNSQNQQYAPPHTPSHQNKNVRFNNNKYSRRNSQGNNDPAQKTPTGNNTVMRDSDSSSSSSRHSSNDHSKIRRFDRRAEEGILAAAEFSDATAEEIYRSLWGLKERKDLWFDNDILNLRRLALCSNCQALASTVKELESRVSGLKSYQWTTRGPLTALRSAFPASPLATPAPPTTALPVDMESPVDWYLETLATAVKNKDRQAMTAGFTIRLLDLASDWQKDFYERLNQQLNDRFPKGVDGADARLLAVCKKYLTKKETGNMWSTFIPFVVRYLLFVRDFKATETDSLQNQAGTELTALRDSHLTIFVVGN